MSLHSLDFKVIFLGLFVAFIFALGCNLSWRYYFNESILIDKNANMLFYNSPIIAEFKGFKYVAYLRNDGKIIVAKLDDDYKTLEKYIVHDYGDLLARRRIYNDGNVSFVKSPMREGYADDHLAPAIIYDSALDTILLATSKHGGTAYIYKFEPKQNKFSLLKKIEGRFTYPRFVNHKGKTHLFIRERIAKKTGDLVKFSSADGFGKKNLVLKSKKNTVVYASNPYLHGDEVYFTYGYHSYDKRQILEWHVLAYNLTKNTISKHIDLTKYSDGLSTRPTAVIVGKNGQNILVGTALLDYDKYNLDKYIQEDRPMYFRENLIKILSIDKGGEIKNKLEKIVKSPYYHSDVYIDEDFNYAFFDKDKIISNLKFDCDKGVEKIYPYLYKGDLFYVIPKSPYQLRHFDTELRVCKGKN